MTKRDFKTVKKGSIVITNGLCSINSGIRCKVVYISEDRIWIRPIDGNTFNSNNGWCLSDWNEVSYKAVTLVKDGA